MRVCLREREIVCVCDCVIERKRDCECECVSERDKGIHRMCVRATVCVCVCMRAQRWSRQTANSKGPVGMV